MKLLTSFFFLVSLLEMSAAPTPETSYFPNIVVYTNATIAGVASATNFVTVPLVVASSSSITVDFSGAGSLSTLLSSTTTLAASNQIDGRTVDYEFYNTQATNVSVILPSTWRIQSGAVTNILAPNATASLSMRYYSFITNTVALWASE